MEHSRRIVDPETYLEFEAPAFATDDEAIGRERRRRTGGIPTLELRPEIGCLVPVWSISGGPLIDLHSIGIPKTLEVELKSWLRTWEDNFHYDVGWSSPDVQLKWILVGEELYARLYRLLWDRFELQPAFRSWG